MTALTVVQIVIIFLAGGMFSAPIWWKFVSWYLRQRIERKEETIRALRKDLDMYEENARNRGAIWP